MTVPRPASEHARETLRPDAALSQNAPKRPLLSSDTHNGGDHEEPDQKTERELHDGDAEQRLEPPMPGVRQEVCDEPGGRRVDAVDGVPLVRMAHDPEGDRSLALLILARDRIAALESALAVVKQERDEYREALERIALGITGRRADFREGEHGRYGPLTDWQLARGALDVPSSEPAEEQAS